MLEAPVDPSESEFRARSAHGRMMEALVSGEGLERVAEIAAGLAGAPVRILVPRPGSDGSRGSAAERYVFALVGGEDPPWPEELSAVVPISSRGELLGAVVMLGKGRPDSGRYLEDAAAAALTGVAMMNAREGSEGGGLIAGLLSGQEIRAGEIMYRARQHGCDLRDGVLAVCVEPDGFEPAALLRRMEALCPEALCELHDGLVFALLPTAIDTEELEGRLGDDCVSALSSRYKRAARAPEALEEAEVLLALVKTSRYRSSRRPTWETLRLAFRLFVADPGEVADFGRRTVGAVIDHDEQHQSELESTFWAYLESNCNMNLTAQATYTHRHTVGNRLARIAELTGLDPIRSYDRELIGLGLRVHRVVQLARPR
jgi:hypothetical protein